MIVKIINNNNQLKPYKVNLTLLKNNKKYFKKE
jgi:hypothetical protein